MPSIVSVTWNLVPSATSYNVYVAADAAMSATYLAKSGVAGPTTSFDLTSFPTLSVLANNYVAVTAVNAYGESPKSNIVTIAAHAAPIAPNGVVVS